MGAYRMAVCSTGGKINFPTINRGPRCGSPQLQRGIKMKRKVIKLGSVVADSHEPTIRRHDIGDIEEMTPINDPRNAEYDQGALQVVFGKTAAAAPVAETMKTFYVSMAADLLGVYIEYQAESEKAVHQYLERQYLRNGVWKIPWCCVYTAVPSHKFETLPTHIVKAQCGTIFEQVEGRL
jgi:hypothetical protein